MFLYLRNCKQTMRMLLRFKMPSFKKMMEEFEAKEIAYVWWSDGLEMKEGLHAGTTPFCSARSHLRHNPSFQLVPVTRRTCEYGAKGWSTRLMSSQRIGLPLPRLMSSQRVGLPLLYFRWRKHNVLTQNWMVISLPTKRKSISNVGFHIARLLLNSPAFNICSHFHSSVVANFCVKDWYIHRHLGSGSLCSVQQVGRSRVSKERG